MAASSSFSARACWLATALLFAVDRQAALVEAKMQRGSLRIGGSSDADRWQYLSKFGYGIGEGMYTLRVRLNDVEALQSFRRLGRLPSLQLDVFLDEDWTHVESLAPCARADEGPSRRTLPLELNRKTGEWGAEVEGLLLQVVRSHIWYFAVSDCDARLGNTTVELDYELHAVQEGGSELGVEARHMPLAESVALLGFTALLLRVGFRCRSIRESVGALHPVIWALASAAAVQCASQMVHLLHLVRYMADGEGLWLLDVLSEVLFMASQVLHATLLIAIARGYTLLPVKASEHEVARLGFIATLAAHAALVGFGKLQEGTSSHRHHGNDGLVGWVIMVVRLLLLLCFLGAVRSTRERGGYRLEGFMANFQLAGSLYFLAYPIVFLVAQAFAPYLRQPVMQIGLLSMQAVADVWLASLFLSRGAYFKVSSLSAGLLPGGVSGFGGMGFCKDD